MIVASCWWPQDDFDSDDDADDDGREHPPHLKPQQQRINAMHTKERKKRLLMGHWGGRG